MSSGRIIVTVLLLELFLAILAMYWHGLTPEGLQNVTRLSGILSLVLFSIIFLFRHKPGHFDVLLLRNPYLVLAVAQGVHLAELLYYFYLSAILPDAVRMAGGFISYLYIFLMPWLLARRQAGALPPRIFAVTEKIFLYYTWLVFFMTYLPRVRGVLSYAGGSYQEHVVLLGWTSLMLGMKITGLLTVRSNTSR